VNVKSLPKLMSELVPAVPLTPIEELTKDAVTDAPAVTVKSIPAAPVESTKLATSKLKIIPHYQSQLPEMLLLQLLVLMPQLNDLVGQL